MSKFLISILVLVFLVANCYSQKTFVVPKGKTVNGFTFTRDRVLKYRGKNFSPIIKFREEEGVDKFEISLLPDRGIAGAIAVNGVENTFFLLNTKRITSKQPEGISLASRMFWSPSRKFLVIYGEYESAGMTSLNLATLEVRQNMDWFPGLDLWVLDGTPKWIGKSDVLAFKVGAGCDPTADPSNPCKDDKSYSYNVRVDAATLKMISKKRVR